MMTIVTGSARRSDPEKNWRQATVEFKNVKRVCDDRSGFNHLRKRCVLASVLKQFAPLAWLNECPLMQLPMASLNV